MNEEQEKQLRDHLASKAMFSGLERFVVIYRPFVNSAYQNINFLISQPKPMLWVLKRTVSMRRLF